MVDPPMPIFDDRIGEKISESTEANMRDESAKDVVG